jgi:ankyrin repeat protein
MSTNSVLPLQHIAAVLVRAGADCSRVSNEGVAPLQWTALWPDGKKPLLKLLLKGGANVTYADPYDGQTALFRAVTGGCAEAVQLLLAAGSDVHHRDDTSMTPLFMVHSLPVLKKKKRAEPTTNSGC